MPPGAVLSIAAQKWAPNATIAGWANDAGRGNAWWTSYYYAAVAGHVDQLVVMAYNTAMPTPQLYALFVKQQVQHILDAVRTARRPPQVLIGIPTYPGNDIWYHDWAENMASGLDGVAAGLNSTGDPHPFGGVAIYRFGLTTGGDWATYDKAWLGR
jgi:spore germination protein YaaH